MVPNKKALLFYCLFICLKFIIPNFAPSKSKPPRFDNVN